MKVTPCSKFMLKLFVMVSALFVPVLGYSLEVGGIIDTDTVWGLEDSPVTFVDTVQVAYGATLTVDPGVSVNGHNFSISVFGNLHINGKSQFEVSISDLAILSGNGLSGQNFTISINYAVLNVGQLSIFHENGSLILRDSKLFKVFSLRIETPLDNHYIERNVFKDCGRLDVSINSPFNKVTLFIKNNLFLDTLSPYSYDDMNSDIDISNSSDKAETIIEGNSFMVTSKVAVRLGYLNTSMNVTAQNNFWNTVDSHKIDLMIHDRNDDLRCAQYLEFEPFLTEPHPDTPTGFNQPPTANAGNDQTAINSAILVGSLSTDPEDDPLTYSWTLTHRANPNFNRTAEGATPSVCSLEPGFYDVRLTVEDPSGNTDTDTMVLAVASPQGFIWDISGDGKRGLEEAIFILQELSGVRDQPAN